MGKELEKAIQYEQAKENQIPKEEKPVFHVASPIGWINDPNGFSMYNGQVHLFYQYHPYTREWGPMHWGHVVSDDMVSWKQLPVAIAPEEDFDKNGCFSGSAIQAGEKQILLYTGVSKENIQNQCLAVGDGISYEKAVQNPVITVDMLPKNCSRIDFRDPKVWKEEDTYYAVIGNKNEAKKGQVVLFSSKDLYHWNFETILAQNEGEIGTMWECPDFFALGGMHFLVCSPQDMRAQGYEFHNGHNTVYFAGKYDKEKHIFTKGAPHSLDYGMDFYAPQTTKLDDGRQVLIAWLKSWDNYVIADEQKWQGMMTIPRQLAWKEGKLYQNPVEELKNYRQNPVIYQAETITGLQELEGISGRVADMTIEFLEDDFEQFRIELANSEEYTTNYTYYKESQTLVIDRTYCGVTKDVLCHRICKLPEGKKPLKLRFLLDRYSIELFINDGEQTATTAIPTPQSADRIRFFCDKKAVIKVEKYDIAGV